MGVLPRIFPSRRKDYDLKELEPLATRRLRHSYHLSDNGNPHGDYFLLQGKANTFFFEEHDDQAKLYPPFEEQLKEPLVDLLKALLKKYSSLSLIGFEESALGPFDFKYSDASPTLRIFQTPLKPEEYQARVAKFRRAGFTYRKLVKSDISEIVSLISRWAEQKKAAVQKKYGVISFDASEVAGVETKIGELKWIRNELRGLEEALEKDEEFFRTLFCQPFTHLYGTFKEGKLVAYLETEGNNTFQDFCSRASERVNSYSPQEFLDLQVALEFVNQGVTRFERGVYNKRIMIEGLMKYKEKFGPLQIVHEVDYEDVEV